MTKDDLQQIAYEKFQNNNQLALMWAPGCGKTGAAAKIANDYERVLVVLSKRVHKQNWLDECNLRGYDAKRYKFICYRSVRKENEENYDLIIFDEAHNYTECSLINKPVLFLSGSLSHEISANLLSVYPRLQFDIIRIADAQALGILPEYKLNLIPLHLSLTEKFTYRRNIVYAGKSKNPPIKKIGDKLPKICDVIGTEQQVYDLMVTDMSIAYALNKKDVLTMVIGPQLQKLYMRPKLRELKNNIDKNRSIIFIDKETTAHSLGLGNRVVFNNKKSQQLIEDFNNETIDFLVSIHMLKESINLKNVKKCIILYATKYYSKTGGVSITQQIGRALRSNDTVIDIYYIAGTKDEDNIMKLITTII